SPTVKDGLFGLKDWRKNLVSGTLKAESFDATGIWRDPSDKFDKTSGAGARIDRISLTGVAATADRAGTVSLGIKGLTLANLSVKTSRDILLAERTLLESVPIPFNRERDEKRITAIDQALGDLDQIEARAAKAEAALNTAKAKGKPGPI